MPRRTNRAIGPGGEDEVAGPKLVNTVERNAHVDLGEGGPRHVNAACPVSHHHQARAVVPVRAGSSRRTTYPPARDPLRRSPFSIRFRYADIVFRIRVRHPRSTAERYWNRANAVLTAVGPVAAHFAQAGRGDH